MDYPEITKPSVDKMAVRPNLDHTYALGGDFDWAQMEAELGIQQREELNLAHLAIDRHAASNRRDKTALFWEGRHGETESYSFGNYLDINILGMSLVRHSEELILPDRCGNMR